MRIEDLIEMLWFESPSPFSNEDPPRQATTASFIAQNAQIPVPRVLCYELSGPDSEVRPFIIIHSAENRGCL